MQQLLVLLLSALASASAFAWGDGHQKITEAALAIIPDKSKWEEMLGADNWRDIAGVKDMTGYAGLPDNQTLYLRRPYGEFFPNDYLLTREVPFLYGYHVPDVGQTKMNQQLAGFAQRALQALRTEAPREAARRIGTLLHFCEDSGATAHAARISPPAHTVLDNTVPLERVILPDYRPVLLGKTDDEFIRALIARVKALIAYSDPIGKKLLLEAVELAPVYKTPRVGRTQARLDAVADAQVPPALECIRVVADTLCTLLTLSQSEIKDGAALSGQAAWAPTPIFEKSGAEILLLDAKKLPTMPKNPAEIYAACTPYSTHTDEQGGFSFHGLPDGTYRVLAYRVGSVLTISEPLTLVAGKQASVELRLQPTAPAANLIHNPALQLSNYVQDMPDRWMALAPLKDGTGAYLSAAVPITAGKHLRFGAALLDPAAKVSFIIVPQTKIGAVQDNSRTMKLGPTFDVTASFTGSGGEGQATPPQGQPSFVLIYVETSKPLHQAVSTVWLQAE